jgi:hypothetical protein
MELRMYINGELVDAIALSKNVFYLTEEIEYLKFTLQEKNEGFIAESEEEPEFHLENIPSCMNISNFYPADLLKIKEN